MSWHFLIGTVFVVAAGGCADQDVAQNQTDFYNVRINRASASPEAKSVAATRPAEVGSTLPDQPTLGDYLTYAALNSPALESAFYRWKAALERIPQAKALSDPQFTYRYFIVEQMMRNGNIRNTFEISQTIPWLAKLTLRGEIASEEAAAAQQRLEAERLRLTYRVKWSYYEYYYLARALAVTRESLDRLNEIEKVAEARYRTGSATAPDVLRLTVEAGKLENECKSLEDMRQTAVARLNAAIGRPNDLPLPWPKNIEPPPPAVSDQQLLSWLVKNNPELKAMEHDIVRERKAVNLAKQDYFPDLTVGLEYDPMTDVAGTGENSDDQLALIFGVNIPIWWEKYAAGVREASHRAVVAGKDKADKEYSLGLDVKTAAYNFRNAQRKVSLYSDSLIPRARQSLDSVQAGYQTGASSFSDLIDAQRMLLELQLTYERAAVDRLQSLAELETLVGRELPGE